jgi:hypothetical protein
VKSLRVTERKVNPPGSPVEEMHQFKMTDKLKFPRLCKYTSAGKRNRRECNP